MILYVQNYTLYGGRGSDIKILIRSFVFRLLFVIKEDVTTISLSLSIDHYIEISLYIYHYTSIQIHFIRFVNDFYIVHQKDELKVVLVLQSFHINICILNCPIFWTEFNILRWYRFKNNICSVVWLNGVKFILQYSFNLSTCYRDPNFFHHVMLHPC